MENAVPNINVQEEGRTSKRGRIIGKLFGRDRERKVSQGEAPSHEDLNDFLRGPSDTLQVAHAAPPPLTKLDIGSARRYPNASDVDDRSNSRQDLALRPAPQTRRTRKGLIVRFVDTYPEVMGTGGDECEDPTFEISKRRPRPSPGPPSMPPGPSPEPRRNSSKATLNAQAATDPRFSPGPLRRMQTGYATIPDAPPLLEIPAGRDIAAKHLDSPAQSRDEKRKSFIEIHQAEMREAEGLAFVKAVRTEDDGPDQAPHGYGGSSPGGARVVQEDVTESPVSLTQLPLPHQSPVSGPSPRGSYRRSPQPPLHDTTLAPINTGHPSQPPPPSPGRPGTQDSRSQSYFQNIQAQQRPDTPERASRKSTTTEMSPSSIYSTGSSLSHPFAVLRQGSRASQRDNALAASPKKPTMNIQDVVINAGDDALQAFVARTRHLYELFRLYSESIRPLVACSPQELARASLWWFLTGRMGLENAMKERPATSEYNQKHEMAKQQAYADLAKGYWLSEEIIPELAGENRTLTPEVDEVRATLVSNLRKLAMSMKRNDILPPEEPFLPQQTDRTIWLEYPQVNQDIVSLLWGSSSSSLAQPTPLSSGMSLLEGLPLGDSPFAFCFARFRVDLFLMEQGRESQHLYFPCFLSIVRPQTQPDILFVIASQDGSVQLRISGSRSFGPTWEDVRWRPDKSSLEVRLPRGFVLAIQCSQQHHKMLWNMYDFSVKVHSTLFPRQDETLIFRSTLRAFQYFDNDPQSRQFPKESTPDCEIGVFEKTLREGAAAGPRTYHRGYRVAVVTGTKTKTLSGVNQSFTPQAPIQYGFLRSDANDPALSLKFENGRLKGSMVMSFGNDQERLQMHSLFIGTALNRDETIYCDIPLQGLWFSERYGESRDANLGAISQLPWQKLRVINYDNDGERPSCVLADKLRVVYEFKEGTMTDRVNVAPGELRLRLDVKNLACLMVFRQPQVDITLAVKEALVKRELPSELSQALEAVQQTPTIRTYMFPSVADMHTFQTAMTGYKVLYDGVASAFAIARRRMVVPIHKKWEAGATRIQVVQQDGVIQLLAFFQDFSHGQCMGFNLKGTDVFESFGRGAKAGLKIVDAKFPLPRVPVPDADGAVAAAEASFVCLDLPELPGEHDDISIIFDSESERDKVLPCLPAAVKEGSRLPKIKGLA
ncbi:hypothetical protein QBC39DRAFT_10507 [Podospora conica]|nr:hypothetical protein QBC39DRAFT_10507 [Schizothecium conicum]